MSGEVHLWSVCTVPDLWYLQHGGIRIVAGFVWIISGFHHPCIPAKGIISSHSFTPLAFAFASWVLCGRRWGCSRHLNNSHCSMNWSLRLAQ